MADLKNYFEKTTEAIINRKRKHRQEKNSQQINTGILNGAFYAQYSRHNNQKNQAPVFHNNSIIKARLQGNILEVIKRNHAAKKDENEKPMETVYDLPSKMFQSVLEAPNYSFFKKPRIELRPQASSSRNEMTIFSDLHATVNFKPPITSTPFQKIEDKIFLSNITPVPLYETESQQTIASQEILVQNISQRNSFNTEDYLDKYEEMCNIMNAGSESVFKKLYKNKPSQISVTAQKLREIHRKHNNLRNHSNLNETFIIQPNTSNSLNQTFTIDSGNVSPLSNSSPFSFTSGKIRTQSNHSLEWLNQSNNYSYKSQESVRNDSFLNFSIKKGNNSFFDKSSSSEENSFFSHNSCSNFF